MTTATTLEEAAGASAGESVDDVFALEVHVIADVHQDLMPTACDTNDGCKGTCASACTST
ncbi:FxLD family lanthipeptide [Streptomyces johnsoniae]|uniref:FxLD family lanthipeptide n=1 Tax=Streptomyces johnsoniae TaxID=3075532 RepID=A0ABU2SCZ9_9ACTN|nr:FxLD family lanthipeptide [Streptomyces sp. DSM 41886]MDT0445709.1 FxLD family lanthipeptide [Streptomyces sp. DSM 41886]